MLLKKKKKQKMDESERCMIDHGILVDHNKTANGIIKLECRYAGTMELYI